MKIRSILSLLAITAFMFVLSACSETEDPGPLQEAYEEYSIDDFDRLEIGDAIHIDIEEGNYFEVSVRGDRRNVDDLDVFKEGSTLIVRFDENRNRHHDTYVTITMPTLRSVNFSGASDSRVSGFYELENFDVYLSGASTCQLDIESMDIGIVLSGASVLTLRGEGINLDSELSGASVLRAFDYPVANADVVVSGASTGKLTVENHLDVSASGASSVRYRGNPTVDSNVSDSSTVQKD
jgi:hypothetical protein